MLASEPVKTMLASLVPSPVIKDRPASVDKVMVPSSTDNVTSAIFVEIRSTSLKEIPGIVRLVSSFTVCVKGTIITGASFTGVTSKRTFAAFALKAVELLVSTWLPAVPEDLSQTLKPRG